jgi:hypothetical protein
MLSNFDASAQSSMLLNSLSTHLERVKVVGKTILKCWDNRVGLFVKNNPRLSCDSIL